MITTISGRNGVEQVVLARICGVCGFDFNPAIFPDCPQCVCDCDKCTRERLDRLEWEEEQRNAVDMAEAFEVNRVEQILKRESDQIELDLVPC